MEEVQNVEIDSLVILKILKHAKETPNKLTTGQLHGVFIRDRGVLEITHCYPVPNKEDQLEGGDAATEDYDSTIMRQLDEINLDNNKVGWYQVSFSNDHLNVSSFLTHYHYRKDIPNSVFLVLDLLELERGVKNPFKVYKINEQYNDVFDTNDLNRVKKFNLKFDKLYIEIPYKVTQSPLAKAFLFANKKSLQKKYENTADTFDFENYLERNIDYLAEAVEDHVTTFQKFQSELKLHKNDVDKRGLITEFMDSFTTQTRLESFAGKIKDIGNYQIETSLVMKDLYGKKE